MRTAEQQAEVVNQVASDLASVLHTHTAVIDAGGEVGFERAAVLIALLRSYATVLEEQAVPEAGRQQVEALTKYTTTSLRGALVKASTP